WLSAFFDLFLTPFGAFNAQGLLYIVLGWWAAWLLINEVTRRPDIAFLFGFPFGMGLHVFRDLNWYTIEKAAVFWIPLYAWALIRAHDRGGKWRWLAAITFLGMSFTNLYLGLVSALLAVLVVAALSIRAARTKEISLAFKNTFAAAAASAILVMPLVGWQFALMSGGEQLASPEQFLWERAALDSFTLSPLKWNRLEIHRALNLIALGLAIIGVVAQRNDRRVQLAAAGILSFSLLSLGPELITGGPHNPVYMTAWYTVPGFWRIAKPETFFHVSWMLILTIAAIQLKAFNVDRRGVLVFYAVFVAAWMIMVRSHPVYPTMTMPIDVKMNPNATQRAFQK
ncbi:MAG: hypothetical protein AAFV53_27455, partial [Myxococcota bacterium]